MNPPKRLQDNTRITTYKQIWKCKTCNKHFTEHKTSQPQKEFVYQNQEWAKTNWAQYNQAQINEKTMLLNLTEELLNLISIKTEQTNGRPPQKVRDMVFCMLLKTYTGLSSRRLQSDLKTAKDLNYISKVPCYSTLMLYFNDKRLQALLQELIHVSAIPLKDREEQFAIDSSGFSTSKFGRWFDYKWDKEKEQRIYQKAHIMCGTLSNVVVSVEVTNQRGADCPQFKHLLKKGVLNFRVKEVSADRAYCSHENYGLAEELGVVAFIPFRSNMSNRARGLAVWKKMYDFSKNHPQAFGEKYHRRSNVESTFNMIKQKFGSDLMTKNFDANMNEILCKILCHNLCCLITAYFKLNVETVFCTETKKHIKKTLKY